MNITFKSSGLDKIIEQMKNFSGDSKFDEVKAVNKVIISSRANAAEEISSQVNLSKSYLGSPNDRDARLAITQKATRNNVEAVISARVRPTSLARFASGKPGDVRVAVLKGKTSQQMRGAFIVRLSNGNDALAQRVHAGSSLRNSYGSKRLSNKLYLLYGPSVDQVFQTVREDIAPKAILDLRAEMYRLRARRGAK